MRWLHAGWLGAFLSAGCASDSFVEPGGDAGPDPGRALDASAEVSASFEGGADFLDVLPIPNAACETCVRAQCGMMLDACASNPVCRSGLLCTFQTCVGASRDAATDFGCVLGCFDGDSTTTVQAIESLSCLTTTCAAVCAPPDASADAPIEP